MNASTILNANVLDIIFEGKNKAYGAYDLRKTYNKRMSASLVISMSLIALCFVAVIMSNKASSAGGSHNEIPPVVITNIPPVTPLPPLPPKLPSLPKPHVATVAFVIPVIVKDDAVIKPPPDVQQINDARIDLKTTDGFKDIGAIAPPAEIKSSQVLAVVKQRKNEDSVFMSVQIEASFPGGEAEWSKYVSKSVGNNVDEFTENDYGTCMIKFIVDKKGKVSNVEATSMKGTKLAEIAVNAIRKGPDWIPAQQNGSFVNAYRYQPITLKNPNE